MERMEKQTAVDWLVSELEMNILWTDKARKAVQQAKEIQKQQTIEAMDRMGNTDFYCEYESPEQYYNETFKSE